MSDNIKNFNKMSKEEIDLKIAQGISDINEGRVISIDDFEKEFEKRNGI